MSRLNNRQQGAGSPRFSKLNSSTYTADFVSEPIVAEVGDAKQSKFYPRVKLSKWDNEANFSVGLGGSTSGASVDEKDGTVSWRKGKRSARFYELRDPGKVPLSSIRRSLKGEKIEALAMASEFELVKQIHKPGEMYLSHYRVATPALSVFDLMPANLHVDVDKRGMAKDFNYSDNSAYHYKGIDLPRYDRIPLVRIYTPYTPSVNPCYMDDGVHQFDMQWYGTDIRGVTGGKGTTMADRFMDVIQEVLASKGVETTRHTYRAKLYFKHEGRLVKFYSGQEDPTGLYSYINISADYNKAFDFYKPDIGKDVRDTYAYGIQHAYPQIDHDIVPEIMDKFAKRLGLPLHDQPFNPAETKQWNKIQQLQDNYDWVANAKRSDANWHYVEPKDGIEFEVVLDSKPSSNEVPLTTNLPKNVVAYYQGDHSFEEMKKYQTYYPFESMKSLAIYHNKKQNNEYKTGKVAHIYRPMAWDSTGHKVWCDFKETEGLKDGDEYDLGQGLTVVVPQDFLNQANYPVTVDPTFGYTTAGAASQSLTTITGQKVRAVNGTVDSLVIYASDTATTETWNTAIYKTDGTLLKAGTAQASTNATTWTTFTGFSSQVVTSIDYYLVGWSSSTPIQYDASSFEKVYFDATSGQYWVSDQNGGSYTTFPSSETFDVLGFRQYSIYVNYTANTKINVSDTTTVSGNALVTNNFSYNNGYRYRRKITVDHTKVQSTNQTNFPVLINGTNTYLKTTANSGLINSSSGYDIRFEDTNGAKLDYELEKYVATSGEFVAWVRIPTLSTSTDTDFYMYYSNDDINTSVEQNPTGVWDSNYISVYHLKDGTTLSLADSTSNALTLANQNATATTGQIDGGVSVASASSQYLTSGYAVTTSAMSVSGWVKGTTFPGTANYVTALISSTDFTTKLYIAVKSNGKLNLGVQNTSATNIGYDGTGSNTLSTGTWYHIALTYSSSAGLTGYVNGSSDGTAAANGSMPVLSALGYIGTNSGIGYFNGALDELRYSNTVRSADWTKTEYNNQSSPSTFYSVANEEWGLAFTNDVATVSDSATVSIVGTAPEDLTINKSDDTTVTDIPLLQIESYISRSDDTTVTDVPTIDIGTTISKSDDVTVTDAPLLATDSLTVNKSDDTTVTDAPTQELNSFIDRSDEMSATDVPFVGVGLSTSKEDDTTVTDTPLLATDALTITKADNTTATDVSFLSTDALIINKSDDVAVSDVPAVEVTSFINKSDDTTASDTPTVDIGTGISVGDPVSITDEPTITAGGLAISKSDDLTVTDVPLLSTDSLTISKSDGIAVTDLPVVDLGVGISKSDDTTVSDVATASFGTDISVSDPLTVTDQPILGTDALTINKSDDTTAIDVPTVVSGVEISKSDDATVTDAALVQIDAGINKSDAVEVSDVPSVQLGATISVNDPITVTDQPILGTDALTISKSDDTTVSDVPTVRLEASIFVSDPTTVTDTPNVATDDLTINKSDTTTVSDSPSVLVLTPGQIAILTSDGMAVSEATAQELTVDITKSDDTAVADAPTTLLDTTITINEPITITDQPNIGTDSLVINRSDVTTVTDTPLLATDALTISKSDDVALTDVPTVMIEAGISKSDDTTVIDVAIVQVGAEISRSDIVEVSDVQSVMILNPGEIVISTSDDASVSDVPILATDNLNITRSDTTTVSDSSEITVLTNVSLSDGLLATEYVDLSDPTIETIHDDITITDAPTIDIIAVSPLSTTASDSVTVDENGLVSIQPTTTLTVATSDNATISDTPFVFVAAAALLSILASEDTTITESGTVSVAGVVAIVIAVNDLVEAQEALNILKAFAAYGLWDFFE